VTLHQEPGVSADRDRRSPHRRPRLEPERGAATIGRVEGPEREPETDRGGPPLTLIAFFLATIIAVGGVVVLADVNDTWGMMFAVVVLFTVLALLVAELGFEIADGPPVRRRRARAVTPAAPPAWSGPPADRRVLLVASEPLDESRVAEVLDGDGTSSTAVLVVAPALRRTRLRYWVSESDEALEHARSVQEATLRALRSENVPSSGHVGSPDPVTAIADALRFFDADRIALAMHTAGPHRYRERDLRAEVARRFGRPVTALEPAG
jgi:hypothetical protein